MVEIKDPASSLSRGSGRNGKKKHKRSASLTACFPIRKSFRQWERENLLDRIQRNSNRRAFTLPPRTSNQSDIGEMDDGTFIPSVSIATTRETDQSLHRRSWNFPIRRRRSQKQTEINQSFLRAARSGNIGKITEYLNSNVDINAVSSVSYLSFIN